MSRHTELAPAKINLALRIVAREPDGYHRLATVFQAIALHDTLEATFARATTLHVEGDVDVGPPEHNLVVRAARAFRERVPGAPHVAFHLTKRIPSAAGLGGGSSDAAAALRALNHLAGHPLDGDALAAIGARIGADVPFFLCGSTLAVAGGRGDRLTPLEPLAPVPVIVVDPGIGFLTRDVFAAWDEANPEPAAPAPLPEHIASFAEVEAWAHNDFEAIVFAWHPPLAAIRDALLDAGATFALLTGSGSCVYGVFAGPPPAGDLAARIRDADSGARVLHTRTLA